MSTNFVSGSDAMAAVGHRHSARVGVGARRQRARFGSGNGRLDAPRTFGGLRVLLGERFSREGVVFEDGCVEHGPSPKSSMVLHFLQSLIVPGRGWQIQPDGIAMMEG